MKPISEIKLPYPTFFRDCDVHGRVQSSLDFDCVADEDAIRFMQHTESVESTNANWFVYDGKKLLKAIVVYADRDVYLTDIKMSVFNIRSETNAISPVSNYRLEYHPLFNQLTVRKFYHQFKIGETRQCVFFTHDTSLLEEKNLFRDDQVYMVQEDGEVCCISDFEYKDENLTRQQRYLLGRFVAIPKKVQEFDDFMIENY